MSSDLQRPLPRGFETHIFPEECWMESGLSYNNLETVALMIRKGHGSLILLAAVCPLYGIFMDRFGANGRVSERSVVQICAVRRLSQQKVNV